MRLGKYGSSRIVTWYGPGAIVMLRSGEFACGPGGYCASSLHDYNQKLMVIRGIGCILKKVLGPLPRSKGGKERNG